MTMNDGVQASTGACATQCAEFERTDQPHSVRFNRFTAKSITQFESITTIEPMETYPVSLAPLELSFEEHEKTEATDCSPTIGKINRPGGSNPPASSSVHLTDMNGTLIQAVATKAEPEDTNDLEVEAYENVQTAQLMDTTEVLATQMEQISVSSHSDTLEKDQPDDTKSDPPTARLEQITLRIFATILPDNETPEQRHDDLMQARGRLRELTNDAPILVINCGESNTQLMTIFDNIQNCPFRLDGFPDLATFIAFCERVYDWLAIDGTHAVLLHAEAETAHVRLLLLCHALACYLDSNDRQDPTTSHNLRQYVKTYPNGMVKSPVAWLRYAGYMRLFSPENCLSILRASVCIYHLTIYNFPVFEENKLRLFLKFYSGCPLRLVYTTKIHTFPHPTGNGLKLSFLANPDSVPNVHGLYLIGDIAIFAYHCRPYPARRARLFRLHFHSCQAVANSLTFHYDDFDDICDAFPTSVRLQLHCTRETGPKIRGLELREELLTNHHQIDRGAPRNELTKPLSADEAVRLHDSLENIHTEASSSTEPLVTLRNRKVSFRSYADKAAGWRSSVLRHDLYGTTAARQLRFASQSDSEMVLPPLCEDPASDYEDSINDERFIDRDESASNEDNTSLHKRILNALFKSLRSKKRIDEFYDRQLMPPPAECIVAKSVKRSRTGMVGKKIKQLFSNSTKVRVKRFGNNSTGSTGMPSTDSSSDSNSFCSLPPPRRPPPPRPLRRPPPPRPPPPKESILGKASAGVRGTATDKLGPPYKTRKILTAVGTDEVVASVPTFQYTEDLLEAARRLNFMAGTQELDRLLEELRLTSINMASGLPPVGSHPSTASHHYTPKTYSLSGYPNRAPTPTQTSGYHLSESRYSTTRSASAMGSYSQQDHGTPYTSYTTHTQPASYNYTKQTSYHTERRMDNVGKPSLSPHPYYRAPYSPIPAQRHHSTYTTTLKQRTPMGQRQLSQIHLTIDPECGTTEATQGSASLMNGQGPSRREQLLESELNSARQELAQLRRAISLVDERRNATRHEELTNHLSPSRLPPTRSPGPSHQHQLLTSTTYHTQQHGQRSSSTFQRSHPRQDTTYGGSFPLHKRAMSHTNVYGPRSWSLRSQQGSDTDLAFRRITSTSGSATRSNYSAHRERLRQEREQELLMRQQQSQRQRQMAASSTGLHEHHSLQQQSRHQQQYRSLSAVNQTGGTEAFEEIETIILQPIGRGVQDIDSHVGSLTTLTRAPGGGSLMDGLHRMDNGQRAGLTRRGFSSTQFLHRNTSSSDISKPGVLSQQQAHLGSQPLGPSRFGTSSTLVQNGGTTQHMSASRSQLSTTSSTIIAPAAAPATGQAPITNGWKTEPTKRAYIDAVDASNLAIVQETAPAWYRPSLSREAAISILRQQPPGSFLIRDSTTFKDAFGLAVKVATLPPKVTPKSDDLQSELVRHYLIEVVNAPSKGVRLKGFASEPVFPSLAALIHKHTTDPLALPCRLILPPVPTNVPPSMGTNLPTLVIGSSSKQSVANPQTLADLNASIDNATVTSVGSILGGGAQSDSGSAQVDGFNTNTVNSVTPGIRVDGGTSFPADADGIPSASSPNVPFVCVLHESPTTIEGQLSQGLTFRCLMLGSVDTPQWSTELCFARAVDQLIPTSSLTAAECDRGMSRVRYTEVQLHVSPHDGITIIDLQRRLFLRRHLPNHVLMYCGIEPRKKEFSHPEHSLHGIIHPKIFGIVVRKGISECTTHVFTECDPLHTADSIVRHIRSTYPRMNA